MIVGVGDVEVSILGSYSCGFVQSSICGWSVVSHYVDSCLYTEYVRGRRADAVYKSMHFAGTLTDTSCGGIGNHTAR